jgi:signal transduction histidine kinase
VLVDGVPVAEQTWSGNHGAALHLAALRLRGDVRGEAILSTRADAMTVEHDDVVIFQRAVPPQELAALAARGRGAWAKELDRRALGQRIWHLGWPVALVSLALLCALHTRPRLRYWLVEAGRTLALPACRPVRWALVCGGLISVVLTGALLRHARAADAARFAEQMTRLQGETDAYWEKIAAFLMRARDWVAAQPELTQERWEAWLRANHFPHEHPGVIGLGYAEQVLPGGIAAHEARWSEAHGFAYRVHPVPGAERERVLELEGNPLLPVVLYGARELKRGQWLTNHSILGRDLLHRLVNEPRAWCEGRRVEAAAARNEIASSALETIAPAGWYGREIEGLRLYVPWTLRAKKDEAGRMVPLEADGWRGVLFASVDPRVALRGRYGESVPMMGLRLFAGGLGGDIHDLVADTGTLLPETADRPEARQRGRLEIPFYHRRLHVEAWSTRAFEALSFRRWAWIAGGGSAVLTLLSAALLLAQVRARARQQRVLEALSAANKELLLAAERREAMSRDLHDGSIQNLYALGLHMQRVQQLLATAPGRVPGELQSGLELLNQSIAELRQFILSAGVDSLPQGNLTGALESLVERVRKTTAAQVELCVPPEAACLEPRLAVQVLNIAREAASNALRHASARRIVIRLEPVTGGSEGRRRWTLEVSDDGQGFDPQTAGGGGRGLKNLAARAAALDGRSTVESRPGGGTRVTVEFPT